MLKSLMLKVDHSSEYKFCEILISVFLEIMFEALNLPMKYKDVSETQAKTVEKR